ncbi:MAG: 5-methyltetrahydropteroyltriglutamate--homocysteine S-methyltransferase, partial [Candidatus Methylomirabilales bacterium]
MTFSNVSGSPRIGSQRELKFALESYWRGELTAEKLQEVGRRIRVENRGFMRDAGIHLIPCNDFSLYDHMLDATALVGALPSRYRNRGRTDLEAYFAAARGRQRDGEDLRAMEMTKWFDTNYHYLVPELAPEMEFTVAGDKPFVEHGEDMEEGVNSVPVLIGPISFLLLGKPAEGVDPGFDPLSLIPKLVLAYQQMFLEFAKQGTEWVQFDEPVLAQDRSETELEALNKAYRRLAALPRRPRILIKTYFDHVGSAYRALRTLPVEGIGLDFVHGREPNEQLVKEGGRLRDKTLFAGVVDGRNVWLNDLGGSLDLLDRLAGQAEDLVVSTSCSLLHVPVDLDQETELVEELRSWLAFARQKVREVATLASGIIEGREAIAAELEENREALERRRRSERARNPKVRERVNSLVAASAYRYGQYPHRRKAQSARLSLPLLPTTTIGSFPQTQEIRRARAKLQSGELGQEAYREAMREEIERVVRYQEEVGLDVLVHGEPERNDMV